MRRIISRTNQNKVYTHALCRSEHVVTWLTGRQPASQPFSKLNVAQIQLPFICRKLRGWGGGIETQCLNVID